MGGLGLIVTGAPIWVWPLLVLLVVVGLRATRQREALALPLYFLPLLGVLSINAVSRFQAGWEVWALFALAYVFGGRVGFGFQKGVLLNKSGRRVRLRGEWLTFGLMMVVFWMNFTGGVMRAVAPAVYNGNGFQFGFAVIAGLAAGVFLGRAMWVFTASPQQA